MNLNKIFALASVMLLVSSALLAQPSGPPGGGGGGSTPIDGGVSLLVAGIAAYGAKKIRDNRKKNQ